MKKYLLIAKQYDNTDRGAHTSAKRLANEFPDFLDYKTDKECNGVLDKLNSEYRRIIFVTQSPAMYCFKATFVGVRKLNYVYFIRGEFHPSLFRNTATNGFYYAYENPDIDSYIPFMYDFQVNSIPKTENIPVVGFYVRPVIVPDSFRYAVEFAKNVETKIKLMILGDCKYVFDKYPNVVEYEQTFDNRYFFSNITHYIYPKSAWFHDPFPNSLLEAVHCNKQIILPAIEGRNHKDGIDDIAETINYHKEFNLDKEFDNTNCPLRIQNFRQFYLNLFDNNFEYRLKRSKYTFFNDWLEKEIL
jgi:hypothetical protein